MSPVVKEAALTTPTFPQRAHKSPTSYSLDDPAYWHISPRETRNELQTFRERKTPREAGDGPMFAHTADKDAASHHPEGMGHDDDETHELKSELLTIQVAGPTSC